LMVYPYGYKHCRGKALSAVVEIRTRDDWVEDWTFPDVAHTVTVQSTLGGAAVSKTATFTFNKDFKNRGWFDLAKHKGYADLSTQGFVFPDGTVRFSVTVCGTALGHSKRRRQETEHSTLMWQQMKFADMHICSGDEGKEFPCHRAVIALASPVLEAMLASEMKEGAERRLVLQHASAVTVQFLLEFVYTGALAEAAMFDLPSLRDLLRLAHQYELSGLCHQCASSLVEIMSPVNVCEVIGLLAAYRSDPKVEEQFQKAKKEAQGNSSLFDQMALACQEVSRARAAKLG